MKPFLAKEANRLRPETGKRHSCDLVVELDPRQSRICVRLERQQETLICPAKRASGKFMLRLNSSQRRRLEQGPDFGAPKLFTFGKVFKLENVFA